MKLDALAQFCNGLSVTATAVATDYMTRPTTTNTLAGVFNSDDPIYMGIVITEAFATATSVEFALQSDSTANLATAPNQHATTGTVAIAALIVCATFYIPVSYAHICKNFIGVKAIVTGSSATTGKYTAFLTTNHPSFKPYVVPYFNKTGR